MSDGLSRREFLARAGAAVLMSSLPSWGAGVRSPFKVSVISDEITGDFGRALEIASHDFGLGWVELRGMWNKNLMDLDEKELAEARSLLKKYDLKVCDIGSPLYKVDWPGAPVSKFGPKQRDQFGADFSFKQQNDLLRKAIELVKYFDAGHLRCFDFWRLEDPAPYRKAMDEKLREAAEQCQKNNVVLVLENEHECNTATSTEAARTLAAVPLLKLNWDPGNAAMIGDVPFPDGYRRLPKDRIGHVHCKDVSHSSGGKREWAAMGTGIIDWLGQFRALKADGYTGAVSLETHWRGAGTPEASSRQSMAGMKELLRKAGALTDS
jgi:sugar phosphate isomerase/epimerase